MLRSLLILLSLLVTISSPAISQPKDLIPKNLFDFATSTGECSVKFKKDMHIKYLETQFALKIPKSYTLKGTSLFQRRGISPETGNELQPLQSVLCLANERDKVLVTSADPNDRSCGWVLKSDLANVKQYDVAKAPCGEVQPLSSSELCALEEKLEVSSSFCANKGSSQTAKFILLGPNYNGNGNSLREDIFDLFLTPTSLEQAASIEIFNILEVYDLVKILDTNDVHILLGVGGNLKGWLNYNSGRAFDSILSVYFSEAGEKNIYQLPIGQKNNSILAKPPNSLPYNPGFHILSDHREISQPSMDSKPYLEIAFKAPSPKGYQDLAGIGFIETAATGSVESNWDYFVSLDEKSVAELKAEMDSACQSLGTGDTVKTISKTVFNMFRLLTGDKRLTQEMFNVVGEKHLFPDVLNILSGLGIRDLLLALSTYQDLTPYKKEFCRSSLLIELMQKNLKLKDAEENIDMIWKDYYYEPKGPVKFNWRYTDLSGAKHVYIPLNYLPRSLK
ncbi:hypothetical protein N9X02_03820 [Planktomarina temperata]|nr:hypothetical protein [Planktomarina temperata]